MNVTNNPVSTMHEHRVYSGVKPAAANAPVPHPELTEQQEKVLEKAKAGMLAKFQAMKESGVMPQDTLYLPPEKMHVDSVSRYREAAQKRAAEGKTNVDSTQNGYYEPYAQGAQYQQQSAPVETSSEAISTTANDPAVQTSPGPKIDREYALNVVNRMRENWQNRVAEGGLTISGKNVFEQASSHRQTLLYDENGFSRELQNPETAAYYERLRNPQTAAEKRQAEEYKKNGDLPSMDKSAIPKENFLDAAVEQYKKKYAAIESKDYELGNLEALQKSVLDLDFVDYVQKGFEQAGFSKEDAASAADVFSREFRMGMLNRRGFEQSQLNALRKLNEVSPNLIKQIQYSNYSFDFGV